MRIVIYGAGGIGSSVGGNLGRTGHDVVLIGRPGHVRAINEHGLRLITPSATHTVRLTAVTSPEQIDFRPDDVVFLCVKGQNTEEALGDLSTATRDIPIFCFQNGVRNEEIVAGYFPRVYGVMIRAGAVFLTDGEVMSRRDPPGSLVIGRYPQGTDLLTEEVAGELRSGGYSVTVTPDILPYKWGKLVTNVANAVRAITDTTGEEVDSISRAVRQELRDLLTKAGIRWVSLAGPPGERPATTSVSPADPEAQSSTWQSLTRRHGSVETEFLNGEVVRLARKLGERAPINEVLVRVCQEMAANREPPGKYTPTQLRELLGV
ncbi:MAG: ketopantoate reductase family protein [Chloroflexi bacterium]|nr:ketopantoate reductase family protein [Chloroflexota bacterium]